MKKPILPALIIGLIFFIVMFADFVIGVPQLPMPWFNSITWGYIKFGTFTVSLIALAIALYFAARKR